MKVTIDGVEYAPIPDVATEDGVMAALELRMDSDAGDNITIRDYLFKLLEALWREGDGFSGKRPFGNSGWEYELYTPLVKAGLVEGALDEDGRIEDFDREQAESYGFELIRAVFYGPTPAKKP